MSQLTSNTTAFIEAQQYSQFILDNLHDFLLPEGMWRDVSDFGSGTTLNIKTVGTVSIQDAAEDTRNDWTRYWEEDGIETRLQEAIKATDTLLGDSYFGPAIL